MQAGLRLSCLQTTKDRFLASRPNLYRECFSNISENNVPLLLEALCSNEMSAKEHLEKQQALVKQLAEVLDFVLKFDDLKVCCLYN